MQRFSRSISVDVCDYTNKPLCNLYNSGSEISGQAVDVFVHSERNGMKELRFKLPSTMLGEEGYEDNYRLQFLISDYRIKFQHKKADGTIKTDWFLISESKITHNELSKNYDIRAGHISSLLKTKNLDLEFSDEDGNNVGTIKQIAEAILEGTGWHLGNVATFYEEDKYSQGQLIEKVRSFTSPVKTGAFKMMSDLCELFDAKPIYNGEGVYTENNVQKIGRTVDIVPMNPFSEDLEEGAIPEEVLQGENVLALYYDKNIKNITRTMNTENLVTKLSAYGSYGDRNGLCSLQNAEHAVITFGNLPAGSYRFLYQNGYYYFTTNRQTNGLKWSYLDFASRSYVYDGTNLFKVYREPPASYSDITGTITYEKNYLTYIMDFSYYQKVGLLTDDMLRTIAEYQTTVPQKHLAATEASLALSAAREELMRTASSGNGYLMLDIKSAQIKDGNLVLTLNKDTYSDGVIFRSDYQEAKRNYFTWETAVGLKDNGEALAGKGAVIYIVNQGSPTKWEKVYVRAYGDGTNNYYRDSLGNTYALNTKQSYNSREAFPATGSTGIIYVANDTKKMYVWFNNSFVEITASNFAYGVNEFPEPNTITLWTSSNIWNSSSKVYMFSADAIAGLFGPREDAIFSNRKSIEESTKVATEIHPLYFVNDGDPIPSPVTTSYGWYYRSFENRYSVGDLYFCWKENGDTTWNKVYISKGNEDPETLVPSGYKYYYSVRRKMLYRAGATWIPVKGTVDNDNLTSHFASVLVGCANQEVLTKGIREEYYYNGSANLAAGNYAFKNEFDNYWLFTTTQTTEPSSLRYKYSDKLIWQDDDQNHILKAIESSFSNLDFPVINELSGVVYTDSGYDNGVFTSATTYKVSNNISVHDNTWYEFNLPVNTIVASFDTNNRLLGEAKISPFLTPNNTTHVRIIANSIPTSSHYLRVQNYSTSLFYKNKQYTIVSCAGAGDRTGINVLMDKFIELSHDAYQVKLPALRNAQQAIKDANTNLMETLGDMYREGTWQEPKYVEGDESKLYSDALDNLKEIAQPETTYDFTYLDLYGSDENTDADIQIDWPDIEITDAAHLVDMDLDTNCWAYIDKIDKCYDQPWKTEIEINTRLSMIGQQSFTDVLARIAEVANEVKANQAVYKRAAVLSGSGKLAADRLEGAIQANKIYLLGGTSNWYTDDKGNIVFEAADGNSAMMLTGRGLCIANTKDIYGDWDWRTAVSGLGINADAIYTGYLSAERIEAGSITTDKLSASVGQELEISSNKALMLYATIDGVRPAGGVKTPTVNEGDSYIQIAAKNGNEPAYINIMTGGVMNVYSGSKMNIESGGEMKVKSGGDVTVESGGDVTLKNGGSINVNSGGDITVASGGKINVAASDIMITSTSSMQDQINGEIKEIIKEYRLSTSNSSATGGNYSWQTTIPSATTEAPYVWSRDHYITNDDTHSYSAPVRETGLGALLAETYREYSKSSSNTTAPTTGWSKAIPTADAEKQYVWVRIVTITEDGQVSYSTPFVDSELGNYSAARIWSNNVANGTQSVPYVKSTGMTIKGNDVTLSATGKMLVSANAEVNIQNASGQNAIKLDKNGIGIATSTNLAIAAGADFTVDADRIILHGTGYSDTSVTDSLNSTTAETVRVYKTGTSSSTAPALTQNPAGSKDATWLEYVPAVNTTNKYLWSRTRSKTKAGVYTYGTAVYEGDLSGISESAHKEYLRNNSTTAPSATATGWSVVIPAPTKNASGVETNPYVWVCDTVVKQNGTVSRINIHRDTGLEGLNASAIKAANIAEGLVSVPYVKTTGLTIKGNSVELTAVDTMKLAANTQLNIQNASGNNNVTLDQNGISIGSKGEINVISGGKIKVASSSAIVIGSIGLNTTLSNMDTATATAQSTANTAVANAAKAQSTADAAVANAAAAQGTANSKSQTFRCTSAQIITKDYHVGDIWQDTGSSYGYEYVCKSVSSTKTTNDWVLVGTYAVGGAALAIDAEAGTINMVAANSVTIAAGATINIAANKALNLTTNGTITLGNGSNPFTFGAVKNTRAYMYSGSKSSLSSDSVDGVYVGTDGIALGKGVFKVTNAGAVTASNIAISGGSISIKDGSTVNFNVTNKGVLTAKSVDITGKITATSGSFAGSLDAATGTFAGTMSAACVTSGTMSADRISGGTLILGGNNNGSGVVSIKNASGTEIGRWDNSGITTTAGKVGNWTIGSGSLYSGSGTTYVSLNSDSANSYAIWAGNATASSAPFSVTKAGAVKVTSGTIGGWTLGTAQLNSGSGTTHVALNSDPNSTYAIWAGADSADSAPFRVDRDGSIYLTKLKVINEQGTGYETVNLTNKDDNYPFWKLWHRVVTGYSSGSDGYCTSISLSGGVTLNFNGANVFDHFTGASMNPPGATASIRVGAYNKADGYIADCTISAQIDAANNRVNVSATGLSNSPTGVVDCTAIYNNGRAAGAPKGAALGGALTATVYRVVITSNDDGTTTLQGIDVSAPYYAGVTDGWSEAVAKIGTLALDATDWVYIDLPAGNYGGATGQSLDVSNLRTEGANGVVFSSTGSWSGGSRTITLSNGRKTTISLPSSGTWSSYWVADNNISVSVSVGGKTYTGHFTK